MGIMNTILSNAFKGSSILSPPEGIVLYFNLPITADWHPIPHKIFPLPD